MVDKIPLYIRDVIKIFRKSGFEIYFVGGCVRDLLLEKPVNDWDFATNATPEQMLELFPNAFYDNSFGTVGIPFKQLADSSVVEITTYRTEHGYNDRRRPDKVVWGKTIADDLSRRDFTINSMALNLENDTSDNFSIIDPFNGKDDLKNRLIRAVGDPTLRFKEDALRLMRAIRFAAQLKFVIEDKTLAAITNDSSLLSVISGERIREELMKILASEHPYEGIMLLKNTGLLLYIIPELLEGEGISQKRPGRHHTDDVFTHNVLSLKYTTSKKAIVRLACLLHDIGKPKAASSDEEGYVIFYNHEIVGSKIAYEICSRLRFSNKERDKVAKLVRWHMFSVDENLTDSAIRRFIRRIGVENVRDMMDLRVGDRLGGGTQTAESWRLKLFKKKLEEQLAPAPFSLNDLAVDGRDVMNQLKIKPGPKVGKILRLLFEETDSDLQKNTKEYLLERAVELNKKLDSS